MKCEVEFLPVGENSKAGDAIVIRYGEADNYEIMVVDGGTKESGEAVVAHVKKQFGNDAKIAHAVVSHSDADHASGMRPIIENLPTSNLWMHVPWIHAGEAMQYFASKNWTQEGLTKAIQMEYEILDELFDLATIYNIPIYEPFQGAQIGPFTVLSPPRAFYPALMAQFDKTPEVDHAAVEAVGLWIGKGQGALARLLEKALAKAQTWIKEDWNTEWLKGGGITSASNETSTVLYGDFEQGRVLLTADAGLQALGWAMNHLAGPGMPPLPFQLVQIPHHGSRKNVSPSILNRMIGPILPKGSPGKLKAFVSAPKDDATHPRKMVTNAFMRRGATVVATQGKSICQSGGFSTKQGYVDAQVFPFSADVEDYT
jgi:beta-lactamase superfamily II metal-dependent hydrolase